MKKLIENFTQHLSGALEIANRTELKDNSKKLDQVLICGLGGSGIGATIISQIVADKTSIPIIVNKDYKIPAFVSPNTLVICCSYSGNTEETLEMLQQAEEKQAEIACITSGGEMQRIANDKQYNCISIEGGHPPRAAFGLSFPHLFTLLHHYKVIADNYADQFKSAVQLIDYYEQDTIEQAKAITEQLFNKIPVIYSDANYEGVAIRFRQQINENSKMLCWHHVIPEMNHNELVGWTTKNEDLAIVIFRNDDDYFRSQKRIEINKEIFTKYTSTILEVYSKGNTPLERSLYLIHLGDWVSFFLAEKKQVDVVEVNVITHLKSELAKI